MQRYARTDLNCYHRFMDSVYQHWQKHVERSNLRFTDLEAYRNSKLPDFQFSRETLSESVFASLFQCVILFLFTVIFFSLAYVIFLKKDVR